MRSYFCNQCHFQSTTAEFVWDVLGILKRGDVSPLARQKSLAQDWPALKTKIDSLRAKPGGDIAADLVLAHRIRGGVHEALPEEDHFELEALFTGLMRAALLTFVEVQRRKNSDERTSAPPLRLSSGN
jgi:hypothetical protein